MNEALYKTMTRPVLARRFSYFTMAYIAVTEFARVAGVGDGANWEIAAALIAQPLTFVGSRGVEKVKAGEA